MYKGYLLANVFTTNQILKINPNTGEIVAIYDFHELENDVNSSEGYKNYTQKDSNWVLNGIAYD